MVIINSMKTSNTLSFVSTYSEIVRYIGRNEAEAEKGVKILYVDSELIGLYLDWILFSSIQIKSAFIGKINIEDRR